MMMTHIFADSHGETRFADVEMPLTVIPVNLIERMRTPE
jgi:hypothetical protein